LAYLIINGFIDGLAGSSLKSASSYTISWENSSSMDGLTDGLGNSSLKLASSYTISWETLEEREESKSKSILVLAGAFEELIELVVCAEEGPMTEFVTYLLQIYSVDKVSLNYELFPQNLFLHNIPYFPAQAEDGPSPTYVYWSWCFHSKRQKSLSQ
jgi:hypothetical protein